MKAMVSKVHPPRESKTGGTYQKIEMITKPDNTYCVTYVSESNFNFERWQPIIEAPNGIWVTCLQWKDEVKKIISADSPVIFHKLKRNKEVRQLQLKF